MDHHGGRHTIERAYSIQRHHALRSRRIAPHADTDAARLGARRAREANAIRNDSAACGLRTDSSWTFLDQAARWACILGEGTPVENRSRQTTALTSTRRSSSIVASRFRKSPVLTAG